MSKDKAKRTLTWFDNYYSSSKEEEAREYLFEEYGESREWETKADVPDDEIMDEVYHKEEIDWDEASYELTRLMDKSDNRFVVLGYCGLWTGRAAAGKVVSNFKELSRAWDDCDYIKLYEENGHFYIECSHHDGTNCFEMRELTSRGEAYFKRNEYEIDDRELHKKLFDSSHYSRLPNFAKKAGYICTREEIQK